MAVGDGGIKGWRDRGGRRGQSPRGVWKSQSESDVNLAWALVRRPRKAWTPNCMSHCLFTSLKERSGGAACYSPLTTNCAYITLLPTVFQSITHVFRLISFLLGSFWLEFISVHYGNQLEKYFITLNIEHWTEQKLCLSVLFGLNSLYNHLVWFVWEDLNTYFYQWGANTVCYRLQPWHCARP